jgi:hypothetical protein
MRRTHRTLFVAVHVIYIKPSETDHEPIRDRPRTIRGKGPDVVIFNAIFDGLITVDKYLSR